MGRLTQYKLIVPIKRSKHPPEYTARGVAMGIGWAMTPLVGIQMYLVLMCWLVCRKLFKWDFSLLVGCAWTWVNNVLTMLPLYYAFYVTGQLMLGNWGELSGYESFVRLFSQTFDERLGLWETMQQYIVAVLKDWGLAMAVGSLPWAIGSAWLSYRWSLAFARRRVQRRREKPIPA